MAMSIGNMCDKTLRFSEFLKDNLYDLNIGLIIENNKIV